MAMIVAQATGVPPSGGSNAEDFQPPTRNPQADALPTQPQTSNLQNPSSGEVLGEQNLRILVPNVGIADTTSSSRQTTPTDQGGSDVWIFIVVAVAVFIIGLLAFKGRQKPTEHKPIEVMREETVVKPTHKKPKGGKKNKGKRKRK